MEGLAAKILGLGITIFLVIYAVVFHEVSHGLAAYKLGDPTPKIQRRLTLNPIRHLSFVGSFLVPLIGILLFGFAFGWAKPVRVEPKNFKNPLKGMALVGLAGPLANFACAFVSGLLLRLTMPFLPNPLDPVYLFLTIGLNFFAFINIFLGLLNLIPLPPLDGGYVISAFLPEKFRNELQMAMPLIFILVLIFFFAGGAQILVGLTKSIHYFFTGIYILAL